MREVCKIGSDQRLVVVKWRTFLVQGDHTPDGIGVKTIRLNPKSLFYVPDAGHYRSILIF